MKKKYLTGNIIKNILILVVLFVMYFVEYSLFEGVNPKNYDSILSVVSILSVAALFGDYSFSYEFSNLKNKYERFLGHLTTFLVMLSTGLLLEAVVILIGLKGISIWFFGLMAVLLYSSLVAYDFWDLLRNSRK